MKDNNFKNNKPKTNNYDTESKRDYSYYSRVLQKPFDSINELKEAEAAFYAEQKAKEDKATQKKADASKVEEAFKAMNQARKDYKENILKLTDLYQQDLKTLKENFENDRTRIQNTLADAETQYSEALKAFTDKYPEGYHLTLKDGDFETTISGSTKTSESSKKPTDTYADLFKWVFGI